MHLRWLLFDYSDPRVEISPRERARIWARMVIRADEARGSRLHWIPVLAAPPIWFVLAFLFDTAVAVLLLTLSIGAGAWVAAAWIGKFTVGRAAHRAMRELGYDVCMNCGYWLRGLGEDAKRCPECGDRLTPREAS